MGISLLLHFCYCEVSSLIKALLSGICQDDDRVSPYPKHPQTVALAGLLYREENLYPEDLFIPGRVNLFPVYNGKSPRQSCRLVGGPQGMVPYQELRVSLCC